MRQQGFSLIEVMFALLVVAFVVTVSIEAAGGNASSLTLSRDHVMARWVAANEIAQTQLDNTFPDAGVSEGKAEMGGSEWEWRREVRESGDEAMRSVLVSVFKPGRRDEVVSSMEGYVIDPSLKSRQATQ